MKRVLVILLLLASPAAAQQAEKTYTLTVTDVDIGVIAEGLGEVPSQTGQSGDLKASAAG